MINSLKPWEVSRIPVKTSGTNPAEHAGPAAVFE